MNNGFFHIVWAAIAVRINASIDQVINALMGWVGTPFKLCVLAYLIIVLLIAAWSSDDQAFQRFFRQLWLAVIIYTLATNAATFQYYVTGLVQGLTNGVTTAIAGIFGGVGTVTADTFDIIAVKAFAVGVQTFKNLQWYSPKAWLLGLGILLYWAVVCAALAVIFFVYLASIVVTNFLVAFGPLFIAMFFFPKTRMFFDGWLRSIVAGILTQIFTIGWLALFATSLTGMIETMAVASVGTDGANDIIKQIFTLFMGAALVCLFSTMTAFSALAAIRISGGVHANVMPRFPAPAPGSAPSNSVASHAASPGGSAAGGSGGGGAPAGGGGPPGGVDPERDYAFNRHVGAAQ